MNIHHAYILVSAWLWRITITVAVKNNKQTLTERNHLVEHDSDVASRSGLKILTHKQNLHSLQHASIDSLQHASIDSLQHASIDSLQQDIDNETTDVTMTGREVLSNTNLTMYEKQMRQLWSLQKLRIQGQYAYMSLVFLICLMLAALQCMGGLRGRHNKAESMSLNDEPHLLTIKEVLFMKARYLPVLHQNCELKEVFVHDCGNDP